MNHTKHKRRGRRPIVVPEWYIAIRDEFPGVEQRHGPSITHFKELLAIADLLGGRLPKDVRNEIGQLLHNVDLLKVQLRSLWIPDK